MTISKIKKEKELQEAISFLRIGMHWSINKASQIIKTIKMNNRNLGIYGYALKNNSNKIIGVILIFDQGFVNDFRMINISSWYVKPSSRGYLSLLMIKKLLNDFKNFIITDLTPTKSVYKILKSFGFKDAKTHNEKFSIFSILKSLKIINYRNLIFFKNFKEAQFKFKNFSRGNSFFVNLWIDNKKLELICVKTIWEKNFGFIKLKFRGLRILWTSDQDLFSQNLMNLLLFLFFKYKAFFITTHCRYKIKDRKNKYNSWHLYKAPLEFENKLNDILPIGSELANL